MLRWQHWRSSRSSNSMTSEYIVNEYGRRIFWAMIAVAGSTLVLAVSLLIWAQVVDRQTERAVVALTAQAQSSRETNAAVVRIADRVDNNVRVAVELREDLARLRGQLDALERPLSSGRGTPDDADRH